MPAGVVQPSGEHLDALASAGERQPDDVVRQFFFIRCTTRQLAPGRPPLHKNEAAPAMPSACCIWLIRL